MKDCTLRFWWSQVTDFTDVMEGLLTHLPEEERQRADRFRILAARQRFILARAILRHQLARKTGIAPGAVAFALGEHGKPRLASPMIDDPPHFNLSHSGGVVALAIADDEIGVDIENLRPIATAQRLAHRFFSPAERKHVFEYDGEARDRAFLRIWTQKEAYLKATGLGVGMPLRGVETEGDPSKPPGLRAIAGSAEEARVWTLLEVEVPGAVCTVAIRGPAQMIEVRRFTPADLEPK